MPRTQSAKWKKRGKQITKGLGNFAYAGAQFGGGIGKVVEGAISVGTIKQHRNVIRAARGLGKIYGGARHIRSGTRTIGTARRQVGGQKGHPFYGNQYTKVGMTKRNRGGFGRSKSATQRARARRNT